MTNSVNLGHSYAPKQVFSLALRGAKAAADSSSEGRVKKRGTLSGSREKPRRVRLSGCRSRETAFWEITLARPAGITSSDGTSGLLPLHPAAFLSSRQSLIYPWR